MRSFRVRSLFALLAAGLVAAGPLAAGPADAAKRTTESAKAAKRADKKAGKAEKNTGGYRTYAQYEKDAMSTSAVIAISGGPAKPSRSEASAFWKSP